MKNLNNIYSSFSIIIIYIIKNKLHLFYFILNYNNFLKKYKKTFTLFKNYYYNKN